MKSLIKKASWLKPARVAAMITVAGLSLVAYEDLRAVTSAGPAVMRGNASAVTKQYTGASDAYDRSYQGYGVPDFNMEDAVSPLPLPKPPALPLPKPPPLPPGGESPGAEPSGPVMPGDSPPAISPEPGPEQPPKEAPKPEDGQTPAQGQKPNSEKYFKGKKGSTTKRKYGPDGRAIIDVDSGHDHGAGDPHVHDWDWTQPGKERGPARPPKPDEV